jgi:cellulose synthase/poly-beta-1,6-N-acetylglucosamine synthase-like glycosyltransferase
MLLFFFWFSIVYIAYAEIGYLAILWLLSRFLGIKRPLAEITPTVTALIAAYNEEDVILEKIKNTLSLDYPHEKIQILVASDCSTDRTDEIVQEHSNLGVMLMRSCPRQGKIVALRAAEMHIQGELVLFTDADSMLDPGALRALVRYFADPKVGAVGGREVRPPVGVTGQGKGEGLYCKIDTQIKRLEGKIGNQVFVHGGVFAMRRELLPYVPDHLSHDAIVPLRLTLDGFRVFYEPVATSYEVYNLDTRQDWRRRIRTVLQSIQSYLYVKEALNPLKTGFYAIQVLSHRFSRWFVFPVLVLALISNLLLLPRSGFYQFTALLQLIGYGLALAGYFLDRAGKRPGIFYFPFYFVYIHIPAFWAVLLHLSGQKMTTWRPTKRDATYDGTISVN